MGILFEYIYTHFALDISRLITRNYPLGRTKYTNSNKQKKKQRKKDFFSFNYYYCFPFSFSIYIQHIKDEL